MPPTVPDSWADVTAARIPADGLGALAPVRGRDGVRVAVAGDTAWVTWPAGADDVAACLRAVRGCEFFAHRGGTWFRFGARVPTSDGPPTDPGRPLAAVLVPAKFAVVPPPDRVTGRPPAPASGGRPTDCRVSVRLVRGGTPVPATGVVCRVADLLAWAESATSQELATVRGAVAGRRAIIRGKPVPSIPGPRFWGDTVLVPLGFRPDPAVPADTLRAAAGAAAGELLVIGSDESGEIACEVVPLAAFGPVTAAGVLLAAGGKNP